jgi:hypothetical protein
VPAPGGLNDVGSTNVADDTPPDDVTIVADPDTSGVVIQELSPKNPKLTDPVGGVAVVAVNVAVSDKVAIATPDVPDDGDACVVNVGDAGDTVTTSSEAPQASANPLLLASPA